MTLIIDSNEASLSSDKIVKSLEKGLEKNVKDLNQ